MTSNPFKKRHNIAEKVSSKVHLPKLPSFHKQRSDKEKMVHFFLVALVYLAFFIAGFVLSKVHTLLMFVA